MALTGIWTSAPPHCGTSPRCAAAPSPDDKHTSCLDRAGQGDERGGQKQRFVSISYNDGEIC